MSAAIEPREYGPESTKEEIEALRNRVSFHKDFAVLFREVPVVTIFQFDVCVDRIEELLHEHDCHSLIIDLREAPRPGAEHRDHFRRRFDQLGLTRMAVFTGKNFLLNIAAQFVLTSLSLPFSVHKTLAEAEKAIRNG